MDSNPCILTEFACRDSEPRGFHVPHHRLSYVYCVTLCPSQTFTGRIILWPRTETSRTRLNFLSTHVLSHFRKTPTEAPKRPWSSPLHLASVPRTLTWITDTDPGTQDTVVSIDGSRNPAGVMPKPDGAPVCCNSGSGRWLWAPRRNPVPS